MRAPADIGRALEVRRNFRAKNSSEFFEKVMGQNSSEKTPSVGRVDFSHEMGRSTGTMFKIETTT